MTSNLRRCLAIVLTLAGCGAQEEPAPVGEVASLSDAPSTRCTVEGNRIVDFSGRAVVVRDAGNFLVAGSLDASAFVRVRYELGTTFGSPRMREIVVVDGPDVVALTIAAGEIAQARHYSGHAGRELSSTSGMRLPGGLTVDLSTTLARFYPAIGGRVEIASNGSDEAPSLIN